MDNDSSSFGPAGDLLSQSSQREDPISGGSGVPNDDASPIEKSKMSPAELQIHEHTMKRLRHGHYMVIVLACFMALIVLLFFGMAIAADRIFLSFLCNNTELHDQIVSSKAGSSSFPVELVTIIPAVSSALLGLLVLVTLVRFIANYAAIDNNKKEKDESSGNAISDFFQQLIKFIHSSKKI